NFNFDPFDRSYILYNIGFYPYKEQRNIRELWNIILER
ncbi:hypothetical protein CFP56_032141, partial [Quercus suber]